MKRVAVVGASGYIGGELVRLLLGHPDVELVQVTSDSHAGRGIWHVHPNLRGQTGLRFSRHDDLANCDVIFLAMPHGRAHLSIKSYVNLAEVIVDLSADFRLATPESYREYYKAEHAAPAFLPKFVPGIPELHHDALTEASFIAVPGCTANAAILALSPLSLQGLIKEPVFVETKAGSSGSGAAPRAATHHPDRSGVVRIFKPVGHRHEAEIERHCNLRAVVTACSVEMVRGVHATIFGTLNDGVGDADVRDAYRKAYNKSAFVRLTPGSAANSLPEPKILSGTNYCDVGYVMARRDQVIVAFSALDNLMKGGAGNAVQCMNIRFAWPETTGLAFPGLFPI